MALRPTSMPKSLSMYSSSCAIVRGRSLDECARSTLRMHSARPFFPLSVVMCAHLLVPFARFYTLFQYRTSSRKKEGLSRVSSLNLGKNGGLSGPRRTENGALWPLLPKKGART